MLHDNHIIISYSNKTFFMSTQLFSEILNLNIHSKNEKNQTQRNFLLNADSFTSN